MDRFSDARRKPPAGALLPSQGSGSRPAFERRSDTASGEALSSTVAGALRHSGQPLDASIRHEAEGRLGFDFSHVRIHTGESAAASAQAHSLLPGPGPLHPAVIARDAKPGAPATVKPAPPAPPSPPSPPSPETAERQARNAYPKNPRGAALYKKMILGTITEPELSELRGIASFPDNPRAAALYAKLDAGTLTPAEQDELGGYLMRLADQQLALGGGIAPVDASLDRNRENPRAAALRAKQASGPLSREEQAELQGLNGYPDNPRAAALSAKRALGTITKHESAELQAFDTYPYNRRAAALYTRMLLGEQLTWDEKGVIYDENYYQSMGEFLIRLERRAREGRLREGEGSVYEYLRHDPKVLNRKADILRSGRFTSSVFDD